MSYEERLEKLLEVAGDYNAVISSFNLEKALYTSTITSSKEKLQKLMESLSMGDIHISITPSGYLSLDKEGYQGTECLYRNALYSRRYQGDAAGEVLRSDLEELLLKTASNLSRVTGARLSSIAKFISYSNLILASVDEDLVSAVREIADNYTKTETNYYSKSSSFNAYVAAVSSELRPLAHEWYREKAVLAPGMKIGVVDLRTGKSTIRTIKRCKNTDNCFMIAFHESSSIVTDPARVNIELTWYLNTKDYSDIAKAINWKPIADFI